MLICKKCVLNDKVPSVKISSSGICNYCISYTGPRKNAKREEDDSFFALAKKHKHRRYQVIMAYSGGKDSSYTIKLLREKYDVRVLALTFDNGFLSDCCYENIKKVTDYLNVENLIVKYPADKLIKAFKYVEASQPFPKQSLERASSICNLCISLVKNMLYYEAVIRDIPIICFGWTPGQVRTSKPLLKLSYHMVIKMFEGINNNIVNGLGSDYARYFVSEDFLRNNQDRIPYHYYPFVNNLYDENVILREIKKMGWKNPENTDANSSNCLLNSYANDCHLKRYGFHPYTFEIGNLVREGYLTREEGLYKLQKFKNDRIFSDIDEIFKTKTV